MSELSYMDRLNQQIKFAKGKQKTQLKKMKKLAKKNENDSDNEIEYVVDEDVIPPRDYVTYYDSDHDDSIVVDEDDYPERFKPTYYDSDE